MCFHGGPDNSDQGQKSFRKVTEGETPLPGSTVFLGDFGSRPGIVQTVAQNRLLIVKLNAPVILSGNVINIVGINATTAFVSAQNAVAAEVAASAF